DHPRVDLVTTDGFLYPRAELMRRGIMHRKGFPESYDRRALLRFVTDVKSGAEAVSAPVYSHKAYDILPGVEHVVRRPDILILEGLNVLQPHPRLAVSDLFDFSIYVDAHTEDIKRWYIERFLKLRDTAFADPESHFHHFAGLSDEDARAEGEHLWTTINEPNLLQNILPRGPARRWCCARTATTRSHGCACASCERAAAPVGRGRRASRCTRDAEVQGPGPRASITTARARVAACKPT